MKRTPLTRKTPIRKRNAKRLAKRRAAEFGPKADWIRSLPCCACGGGPSDPHHVGGRRHGSKRLVPLCRACHVYGHATGWATFEQRFGVDLGRVAEELENLWLITQ